MPAIQTIEITQITETTNLTDICPYCRLDYCNCNCVACAHCGIVTEIFCPDCYDFCPECCICSQEKPQEELSENSYLDIYGCLTSQKLIAQDFWLKILSVGERMEIMSFVKTSDQSLSKSFDLITNYIIKEMLKFTIDNRVMPGKLVRKPWQSKPLETPIELPE